MNPITVTQLPSRTAPKLAASWLCLLLFLGGLFSLPAAEIKLGILCPESSGQDLADTLTVELSHLPGVTLLERQDLDRLRQEQSLASQSSASLLKTGSLLGADGLVILQTRPLTQGDALTLRVVSVRHGAALGWWEHEVTENQRDLWAKGAAQQIQQLLPKLTRSPSGKTAPISFVGLVSPSSAPTSALLERELNGLLLKRLGAEPDLLVLERQKLLEARFEKLLSGEDRKFWNGAYLLEGTINRDNIGSESVTVHFRLSPPGSTPGRELVATGARTNLAALSEQMVQRVRETLQAGQTSVAWNAPNEARRFYEEAESALRWGFWPEAASAAEAALALGKEDLDTHCVRLAAYTALFQPNPREGARQVFKPELGLMVNYSVPPTPEQLQAALDTAYQLQALAQEPESLYGPEKLRTAARGAFHAIGQLTLKYYIGAELRTGNEAKLADLRATMRKVTEALLESTVARQTYFAAPGSTSSYSLEQAKDLLVLLVLYGPLWQETPEDGLKLHERLRASPCYLVLQRFMDDPGSYLPKTPRLCGWKWADRRRVAKLEESLKPYGPTTAMPWANSGPKTGFPTNFFRNLPPNFPVHLFSNNLARVGGFNPPILASNSQGSPGPTAGMPQASASGHPLTGLPTNAFRNLPAGFPRNPFTNRSAPLAALKPSPSRQTVPLSNVFRLPTSLRLPAPGSDTSFAAKFLSLSSPGPKVHRALWAEGRLWLVCEVWQQRKWATETASGFRLVQDYSIGALDPASGRFESFEIPGRFVSGGLHEPGLAVFPDRLLLFLPEQVVVYNRTTKAITTQPAPLQEAHTLQMGEQLLLFNAESILRTTAELKDSEVLASVRRRPALSPLDSLTTLEPARLLCAGDDQLLALVNQKAYRLDKAGWHPLFSPDASASLFPAGSSDVLPIEMAAGEVLVREELRPNASTNINRGHYYGAANLQGEPWWSGVVATGPRPFGQPGVLPEAAGAPPKYPLLPAAAPFFWVQGGFIDGSRSGCFPFHHQLMSISLPFQLNGEVRLQLWRPDDRQPFTLQVSLPNCTPVGSPAYPPALLVTPDYLFLWRPDFSGALSGIWCIDGKELLGRVNTRLAAEQQQESEHSRQMARLLAPFDRNQNGKLDPEEYPALAKDPALFNLVWSALDQNHNNLIDRDELRWFDFNHDTKLDPIEHQALLNAVSFLASALFLHLDRNQDGWLEESEALPYCNSVLVVPNAFARYATAGERRLNPEQWTGLFMEVLDRRLTSSAANPTREYSLECTALERVLNQPPSARSFPAWP